MLAVVVVVVRVCQWAVVMVGVLAVVVVVAVVSLWSVAVVRVCR